MERLTVPLMSLKRLVAIMKRLRDPVAGCEWDRQQSFASIAPYTIEEAYEVADAIERRDLPDLRDELGDLLLQVAFHAQMAAEEGAFDFGGVVEAITSKLIRRHPHVFGDTPSRDPAAIKRAWDEIKAGEQVARREVRGETSDQSPGLLDDVPAAIPALSRAEKLTRRAAKVGFDWPETKQVVAKIREELAEVEEAIDAGRKADIEDEIGDLLFSVANLARHCDVDAEAALRGTNSKFLRRFRFIENALSESGLDIENCSLDDMEALWVDAKRAESPGRDA